LPSISLHVKELVGHEREPVPSCSCSSGLLLSMRTFCILYLEGPHQGNTTYTLLFPGIFGVLTSIWTFSQTNPECTQDSTNHKYLLASPPTSTRFLTRSLSPTQKSRRLLAIRLPAQSATPSQDSRSESLYVLSAKANYTISPPTSTTQKSSLRHPMNYSVSSKNPTF